jgi:SdpI/YfhL protein family
MEILSVFFVCSGLILAGLSIPLIMGKIGPNPWYGFRVRRSDPVVWYAVNTYSAKRLLIVGIATSLGSIILYFVPEIDVAVYSVACGVIAVGGLIVSLIQRFLFLRSIGREK